MNLSGRAVSYWLKTLKIPQENLLVLVDDVALPFGTLRMREKGSSAGHNGLKSIEEVLGGQHYARLRFGIGNDFPKGRQIEYVLGRWPQEQIDTLPEYMDGAIQMIQGFCTIGAHLTMTQFNR